MLFPEPGFLFLLLPAICLVYYALPLRLKNWYLLLASLFFYWWGEKLFALMVISIVLNWTFGLLVDRKRFGERKAWWFLVAGVTANLLLLGIYKYANFVIENVNVVLAWFDAGPLPIEADISLPIGISFFTFQAISYVVDVYRGDAEKQKNPLDLGLYIALFPQLIMGPIVRYRDVALQIVQRHLVRADVAGGLQRFLIGLCKKTLVANAVAPTVDICFGAPTDQLTMGVAWLGITCYIIQLYFDFSGYSDMAIGLGKMFGFTFPENFNYPYKSRSITEMWRRWHMTLSTWFRDYVYIPLGGNRVAQWKIYFNLFLIFVLCGLWHGAAWTFLIWGVWNGIFLVLERLGLLKKLEAGPWLLAWIYTMLSWMLGLVVFRSDTIGYAGGYLAAMFGAGGGAEEGIIAVSELMSPVLIWGLVIGCIGSFPVVPWIQHRFIAWWDRAGQPAAPAIAWQVLCTILLLTLTAACIVLISAGAYSPFLYTRF